jgi:hypothetical protein
MQKTWAVRRCLSKAKEESKNFFQNFSAWVLQLLQRRQELFKRKKKDGQLNLPRAA